MLYKMVFIVNIGRAFDAYLYNMEYYYTCIHIHVMLL